MKLCERVWAEAQSCIILDDKYHRAAHMQHLEKGCEDPRMKDEKVTVIGDDVLDQVHGTVPLDGKKSSFCDCSVIQASTVSITSLEDEVGRFPILT